ncbi:putative Ig domain-containing protein [Geomonas propionica]|uniref:Ig domain-containing protein n=1 Tax=Geomonas propionica TaxID=2798582 RepID=A0ABS0YX48_9BACT|nr:putative Ig domain-containing protein [Geomonas propionica]MBJ6802491.1 putative Ig domain-containing protein [Geomonas propionica]
MKYVIRVLALLFCLVFSLPAFAACPEGSNWTASWTDSFGQTTYSLTAPCVVYLGIPFTITANAHDASYPNTAVGWNWAITDNGTTLLSNQDPLGISTDATGDWQRSLQQTYTGIATDHNLTFSFTDFGRGLGFMRAAGSSVGGLTVDPFFITLTASLSLSAGQQGTTTIPATVFNPTGGNPLSYRWLEGGTVVQDYQAVAGTGTVSIPLNLAALPQLSIGTHTYTVEVTDGTQTGTKSTDVTVTLPLPTISGSPAGAITIGKAYSFTPTAAYASSFSISNKPAWATFNTSTGALTGTPTSSDAGTYSSIIITASNSAGSTSLAPFSVIVSASGPTAVPVMNGWWLLYGMLAGLGIFARRNEK